MAHSQQRSPETPSAIPKRSFPSFSVRRPSLSNVNLPSQPRTSFSANSTTSAVAESPSISHNSHSLGSGIPTFRSFRNLFPFGTPKQPNGSSSTPSRSSFAGIGSLRRTSNANKDKERERERMSSLSNETFMPIIAIGRQSEEPPLRRSASLSHLDRPLSLTTDGPTSQPNSVEPSPLGPCFRIPSPEPPLLAELSTIMEADSSGISKHIPLLTPSTESSHSLSPPGSPYYRDPEELTIRRPLPTSSHAKPLSHVSSSSTSTDTDLEDLSTSQLAFQVQNAMAGTSWSAADKAVIIDADASFLHMSRDGDVDSSDEEADANASVLGLVNATATDDLSHVNNSTASILNPNQLQAELDATLDLESLDPDLRAAVKQSIPSPRRQVFQKKPMSPSSDLNSSTSTTSTATLKVSPRLNKGPSISTQHDTPSQTSLNVSQSKRRIASSFLPRLCSGPSYSAPASPLNSPSPRQSSFESVSKSNIPVKPNSARRICLIIQKPTGIPSSPISAQVSVSSIQGAGSYSKVTSLDQDEEICSPPVTGDSAVGFADKLDAFVGELELQQNETGGDGEKKRGIAVAVTSTPMKPNVKKGLHMRKSSLPVASWRRKEGESDDEKNSDSGDDIKDEELSLKIPPQVRVLDDSAAEIDPDVNLPSNEHWDERKENVDRLGADGWSPKFTFSHPERSGSPHHHQNHHHHHHHHGYTISHPRTPDQPIGRYDYSDNEEETARILGSPFHTPAQSQRSERWRDHRDNMWLDPEVRNDGANIGSYSSPNHSPSPSPSPSPALKPSSLYSDNNLSTTNSNLNVNLNLNSNRNRNSIPSPSPSPQTQPQNLVPSPTIIVVDLKEKEGLVDGEIPKSPKRMNGDGSVSGRPSRRVPMPLRLFWGSGGNGQGQVEDDKVLIDRQPSPLRSVVNGGESGRPSLDDDGGTEDEYSNRGNRNDGKEGMNGGGSLRPSSNLDSYGSNGSPKTRSPDMRWQRYSVSELSGKSGTSMENGTSTLSSSLRPSTRLREREGLTERVKKRSSSMQDDNLAEFGVRGVFNGYDRDGLNGGISSAALSARERLARARHGDFGGGSRPWSSMSTRTGRAEDIGGGSLRTRTVRGVGYDREGSSAFGGIERTVSERVGGERDVLFRNRSGSVGGVGGGVGTLGRYASLRSASEYNVGSSMQSHQHYIQPTPGQTHGHVRSYSRIAFSENSGGSGQGRRESGCFLVTSLMESPTHTISTSASGRDTARSTPSTAATSVSMAYNIEELRELKEKHAVETAALFSALSDSQRSCRVLREENGELRERMGEVERENERMKRLVVELEREIEIIKFSRERDRERDKWDKDRILGPGAGPWNFATPSLKQRDSTAGSRTMPRVGTWRRNAYERETKGEEEGLSFVHPRSKLDTIVFERDSVDEVQSQYEVEGDLQDGSKNGGDEDTFGSTATPPARHNRRPSTTSSIFPMPPSNMTMLLHDDGMLPDRSAVTDQGFFGSPFPIRKGVKEHAFNKSISSNISISPTTANFSIVTGSPGSLFLRPEHEVLLGEMESLDLGRKTDGESDVWSE